ncbi:hypothetical protein C8J56DRAFT_748964, partial [Mycena floridula]
QWYQTPTLPQGLHTIELLLNSPMDIGLDYMVVVPGPDTSLTGKNIMVDDSFSGIEYVGSWKKVAGADIPQLNGFRLPFQNSTHQSSTVGDVLKFSLSGANLQIYALEMGLVNMTVTYDGGSPEPQSVVPRAEDAGIPMHYTLFDSGPRPAGVHNVVLELTQVSSGAAAVIDYIVYVPAFTTLKTINSSTSSPQSPSSTISVVGTGKTQSESNLEAKKIPIGAIVGGVLGACVILAVLLLLLSRKRK